MRCGLLAVFALAAFAPIGLSADIYVPDHYPAIQDAIDASMNGDRIIVRPGTYMENIHFAGKAITLTSEKGPKFTVIDGGNYGSVVLFAGMEGLGTVLEGFTITHGYSAAGGGICCYSSPTIIGNIITGNTADMGGGICCWDDSAPVITGNDISGNTAWLDGGGIYLWDSSPVISSNTIRGNSSGYGGGIYCWDHSSPAIVNNTVSWNTAFDGGGIACCYYASPIVSNTIIWDNDTPTGSEIWLGNALYPSSLTISYSDLDGGQSAVTVEAGCTLNWGAGMIDADPLFVDFAGNDFHLTWNSPCRLTGDNNAVVDLLDFEGDPRIHDGQVDMGTDEFHPHLYSTGDVVPGATIGIRIIGQPPAPVILALGAGVQDPPVPTPFGFLYLTLPVVQTISLGPIPAEGVRMLDGPVPAFWIPGEEHPFQALVGPPGNPSSLLTNLMILTVE